MCLVDCPHLVIVFTTLLTLKFMYLFISLLQRMGQHIEQNTSRCHYSYEKKVEKKNRCNLKT